MVLGLLLVGLYVLTHVDDDGLDAAYVLIGAMAPLAIGLGLRRHRPVRPGAWLALLASQVLWVVADAIGMIISSGSGAEPFPTVADVFYLAGYPPLALCLFLLTRGRRPRRDLEGLLDSLSVTVGLLLLCWVMLAAPIIEQSRESRLAAAVGAAYPLLDVVVLAMLVALVTTPGASTPSLRLLVAGLALLMAADTAASALELHAFTGFAPMDPLWLASYVLVGAAALHPSMYELSRPAPGPSPRFSRSRLLAAVVTVLVPPATLVFEASRRTEVDVWPIAAASAAMFLLVVARMNIVIQQLAAANDRRDRAQAQLAFQAAHDSLTGLPNRAQALHLIGASLARAQRSGQMLGLMFVDLDGFKTVNDTFGHRAGDEVLRTVAARMQRELRQGDTIGRLGGDEFVVLLEPVVAEESAVGVGERLLDVVAAPITLTSGHRVSVGVSIGVTISQDSRIDAEALLIEADSAAYRAKARGKGRIEVYDESLRRELQARSELENGLRAAIAQDRLVLRYEPVVDLASRAVRGYETQVFWPDGNRLVPGTEFRAVAEQSDLVLELDVWVLQRTMLQLAQWHRVGGAHLTAGFEVSHRHLVRSRVTTDIERSLAVSGVAPDRLVVTISDRSLVDDPVAFGHLSRLRDLGIKICLTHFGNGYSSVRRLERLPVDMVMLDDSFLRRRATPAAGVIPLLVRGVQSFGLPVVAKGVDLPEDLEFVQGLGCDRGQGRQLGEAMEGEEVTRRLSDEDSLLTDAARSVTGPGGSQAAGRTAQPAAQA